MVHHDILIMIAHKTNIISMHFGSNLYHMFDFRLHISTGLLRHYFPQKIHWVYNDKIKDELKITSNYQTITCVPNRLNLFGNSCIKTIDACVTWCSEVITYRFRPFVKGSQNDLYKTISKYGELKKRWSGILYRIFIEVLLMKITTRNTIVVL